MDSDPCCHAVATVVKESRRTKSTSITVTKCKVRKTTMWRVRWPEAGRIRRKFFGGREPAETFASRLRNETVSARRSLASLPATAQLALWQIVEAAQERNMPLESVVAMVANSNQRGPVVTVGQVEVELLAAKRNAGRSAKYLTTLAIQLAKFTAGRRSAPITAFQYRDIETVLDAHKLRYRPTLRARISVLLRFAVRRGYRPDNPCDRVDAIRLPQITPHILTLDEVKTALRWLKDNPTIQAWFILSTFAGLRPEEAEHMQWSNICDSYIRIEAIMTKVRSRRVVEPGEPVMQLLREAKANGASLPLTELERRYWFRKLKTVLRWPKWKADVTRHTAASMLIGSGLGEERVANMLGTSLGKIRSHYKALVTPAQAAEFWALVKPGWSPAATKSPPPGQDS